MTMTRYALLKKDGVTDIAHEEAHSPGEALMVFGKRQEINDQLELSDDEAGAEFFLKWLQLRTRFPAVFEIVPVVRYKRLLAE
jgi:hypothetical protein